MKKRIFASLLAVLMILSVTAIAPVFAEDAADKVKVAADDVTVAAGATEAAVSVQVASLPESGLASARFGVKVEGLSISEGTASADLPATGYSVVGPTANSAADGVMFMWVDVQSPLTADTCLVTFKVAIPAGAACGTSYAVKVIISDDPDDFIAGDGASVAAVEAVDGSITIAHTLTHVDAVEATAEADGNIEYWKCDACGKYFSDAEGTTEIAAEDVVTKYAPAFLPGDANGDGKINSKDVVAIMKAIVGVQVKGYNKDAADMSNDGKVNSKDVVAVMKYIVAH